MKMNRLAAVLAAGTLTATAGFLTSTAASAAPAPAGSPGTARQVSTPPPPLSAAARSLLRSGGRHICYVAHVENAGWQSWVCDGAEAGTTGMSLRMEALAIAASPAVGPVCADAHVQNIGWQGWHCTYRPLRVVTVGTTGESLRMEALSLNLPAGDGTSASTVCATAHVQNIGWMTQVCGPAVTVGTTGQSLRMEAVEITTP